MYIFNIVVVVWDHCHLATNDCLPRGLHVKKSNEGSSMARTIQLPITKQSVGDKKDSLFGKLKKRWTCGLLQCVACILSYRPPPALMFVC